MITETPDVLKAVRKALGRSAPLQTAPVPPALPEPVIRLVPTDVGLPELFASRAKANKMGGDLLHVEEVAGRIVEFLRSKNVRRVAVPVSPLLEQSGVTAALRDGGFEVRAWSEMTLDELYDFDCAVTDVYRGVAETGSLVIRGSAAHGRALSLVPALHVAVVEPKNLLPDLLDLFEHLAGEGSPNITLISGPSKTADIEMNLVTGVHGPGVVQVYVLH